MNMMNYLKRRKLKKSAEHILHEARHVIHMREDIADAKKLQRVKDTRDALAQGLKAREWDRLDALMEHAVEVINELHPAAVRGGRFSENLEVIVVAITVAMAFRTYFIQPFKIPTGSMQPTLNGITLHAPSAFRPADYYPLRLVNFALFGKTPVKIRAVADGRFFFMGEAPSDFIVKGAGKDLSRLKIKKLDTRFDADYFRIEHTNVKIPIPKAFTRYVNDGDYVNKGDVLAAGTICSGDHIFVNKVIYNFTRPKRGNVIVFDTQTLDYPGIKTNTFYIKRLAGLPGEAIGIHSPDDPDDIAGRYLMADNREVTAPYAFTRLRTEEGYFGYTLPGTRYTRRPKLAEAGDVLQLGDDEYLPLGDNTRFSLDGRFFGGVQETHLVGPAFAVYWPLSKRWGLIH